MTDWIITEQSERARGELKPVVRVAVNSNEVNGKKRAWRYIV